jgi:hypothetical protein
MARRGRWFVLAVVVLVAVGAAAAWFTVRPDLDTARDRVDAAWTPLRAPLAARYAALGGVAKALTDGGAGDRAVTKDLDAELARWNKLALLGPRHTDAAQEATIANGLEALARRLRANVNASVKLSSNTAITNALLAYDQAVVSIPEVKLYNHAVHAYEDERSGTLHRLVADLLGYDARPVLVLGTS